MSSTVAFMVVAIVFIACITSLLKARMDVRRDRNGNPLPLADTAETQRMHEELKVLKERVAVLERIATDRNHALEHEIEQLRDR